MTSLLRLSKLALNRVKIHNSMILSTLWQKHLLTLLVITKATFKPIISLDSSSQTHWLLTILNRYKTTLRFIAWQFTIHLAILSVSKSISSGKLRKKSPFWLISGWILFYITLQLSNFDGCRLTTIKTEKWQNGNQSALINAVRHS